MTDLERLVQLIGEDEVPRGGGSDFLRSLDEILARRSPATVTVGAGTSTPTTTATWDMPEDDDDSDSDLERELRLMIEETMRDVGGSPPRQGVPYYGGNPWDRYFPGGPPYTTRPTAPTRTTLGGGYGGGGYVGGGRF